jgi:hypothetical protein
VVEAPSKYQVRYPIGFSMSTPDEQEPGAPLVESGHAESSQALWERFHLKGIGSSFRRFGFPLQRHLSNNPKGQPHDPSDVVVGAPRILTVYFPLIAVVIPEWLRVLKRRKYAQQGEPPPKKVLVLVSGAGQPRDIKANPHDNSTEGTGKAIERFVRRVYPDIEVRHISSRAMGIFRYDDNVRFVKSEVLPVIDAQRAVALRHYGEHWPKNLHVTMCLADGPPARISALNASLRSYRPGYLHVWRLKTFWDERMVSEEDVEFHTFKKLEMRPPVPRSQLAGDMRGLVEEMIRYRRQFEAVRDVTLKNEREGTSPEGERHELDEFWLRKTRKVVMAVLLTKKGGDEDVG